MATQVSAAIGLLFTEDEIMAKRALNFLRGRFSTRDLGWFYKEGFYNVVVIGHPDDFMGGENYFHQIKQLVDTIIHTDLQHTRMLPLSVFQEVSL